MTERNTEVGTNGGLSQRWHEDNSPEPDGRFGAGQLACAKQLDAAKLRIEEAVRALPAYEFIEDNGDIKLHIEREAVLNIIREIL